MTHNRLAIDVGGTFVDFVRFNDQTGEITIEKVASSGKLEQRFFEGVERLDLDLTELAMIVHGSTLVINTIVQEKGARIGLITTQGFRDVLELGRGSRPEIYNLFYKLPTPLVPRYLRFEAVERLNWRGEVLTPLDEAQAQEVVLRLKTQEISGIAICFLHAYANPAHEQRMAQIVADLFPEAQVSISSDVVREWREYERTSTTVLNAYTKPKMVAYLSALEKGLAERNYRGSFTVMQSSGGMTSSKLAQNVPIRTVQSGPAGGVIGAVALGAKLNLANLVSADVGGTTFDVSLIVNGRSLEKTSTALNRRPVLQPTLDIISIGAGGGSIAWLDAEGGLRVGPHSAQADPGPVCFGLGGQEPTVTDAQVLLGYLDPDYYLGKRMRLNRAAAEQAIQDKIAGPLGIPLTQAVSGIIHLTNMNMVLAIRQVTIERGYDPRQAALVCFGGGGGLFAGALLQELEMPQAIIPVNPATFSAWGLLNADYRDDVTSSFMYPLTEVPPAQLGRHLASLEAEARQRLIDNHIEPEAVVIERYADCRYLGQEHTLKVPVLEADLANGDFTALRTRFDAYHDQAYAHALPDHEVEIVHLRLTAQGITHKPVMPTIAANGYTLAQAEKSRRPIIFAGSNAPVNCPIYDRERLSPGMKLSGPAIVEEWTSTTLVLTDQQLALDEYGNLVLTICSK
jgi:N-methylhydantoinase A